MKKLVKWLEDENLNVGIHCMYLLEKKICRQQQCINRRMMLLFQRCCLVCLLLLMGSWHHEGHTLQWGGIVSELTFFVLFLCKCLLRYNSKIFLADLKLLYSQKATKIWQTLQMAVHTKVISNKTWRFCQIVMASSEFMKFTYQ